MYKQFIILFIGVFIASCSSTKQHIADVDVNYVRATDEYDQPNHDLINLIQPYKLEMDKQMGTVLGELPEDLKRERPNSNMGNWFADALLVMANKYDNIPVDIAIQNYGGLRIPFLAKGNITKGNIYELMPFDNKLVIMELDSSIVQLLLDEMASGNGWPISKGLTFSITDGKATNVKIHGKKMKSGAIYRIAMPDYIANGGGDCDFLRGLGQKDSGTFIRDVIIEYLEDLQKQSQKITIDNSQRIF